MPSLWQNGESLNPIAEGQARDTTKCKNHGAIQPLDERAVVCAV